MPRGQTIQSLAVATYYHDDLPLLVICPSSLRLNWAEEIDRWLPIKTDQVFVVFNAKDGLACLTRDEHHKKVQGRQFGVVIISYDLATKMTNEIKQYKFGIIIADGQMGAGASRIGFRSVTSGVRRFPPVSHTPSSAFSSFGFCLSLDRESRAQEQDRPAYESDRAAAAARETSHPPQWNTSVARACTALTHRCRS